MRHSCISFLSISFFLLTACSGEKGSHDQVSTVSIDKGVEHFDADYTSAQYQSLFKNPKTIRLETNDKCLLSANAYLLNVTPKYIVIGDKTSFYFFNAENGSFLSVMDRKGNGPEEYADIFSRFFDEEKELIYVATPNKTKLYISRTGLSSANTQKIVYPTLLVYPTDIGEPTKENIRNRT